jgi:glycerophosphoryl diester phosphodiesterase
MALLLAPLALIADERTTDKPPLKPPLKPLARAHAHNDYEHERPLFDALDRGFSSVEADIWLTPDGLLVAHDRRDLKPGQTLQSLYLDPLRSRVKAHGGSIYSGSPTLYLLVDVKSDAEPTYAALDKLLRQYADILTSFSAGKVEKKAVTVILSGNRAAETIAAQATRFVGIDGRPEDLDRKPPSDLYPWISANWTLLFRWRGEGPLPEPEKKRLIEYIQRAHAQNRQVRFWATPEKENVWRELVNADVDFVNTDQLDRLRAFLLDNP